MEQSRRDDLESAGYTLMYFLRGGLPWQNLRGRNKQASLNAIAKAKLSTSPEALARNYPAQFCDYLKYCRNLGFEERPDYDYLRQLFRDLCVSQGFNNDISFDWTPGSRCSGGDSVPTESCSDESE